MSAPEDNPGPEASQSRWGFWSFIAFMGLLTAVFAGLGFWQLQRLEEKEALIASVAERQQQVPLPLPPKAEWVGLDPEVYNFRPVTVTGSFASSGSVLVFTSLATARGQFSGPGYWVMTPFVLAGGGMVFINRGFVPQQFGRQYATGAVVPEGTLTLTGIALRPEASGAFTPGPDRAGNIEWVRDPRRLAAFIDPVLAPVADLTIDLPAGEYGALPQGGETVIEFSSNHFGYALTWFGFALLTPALLLAWVIRQRRPSLP